LETSLSPTKMMNASPDMGTYKSKSVWRWFGKQPLCVIREVVYVCDDYIIFVSPSKNEQDPDPELFEDADEWHPSRTPSVVYKKNLTLGGDETKQYTLYVDKINAPDASAPPPFRPLKRRQTHQKAQVQKIQKIKKTQKIQKISPLNPYLFMNLRIKSQFINIIAKCNELLN
jgi:hypothetical protein